MTKNQTTATIDQEAVCRTFQYILNRSFYYTEIDSYLSGHILTVYGVTDQDTSIVYKALGGIIPQHFFREHLWNDHAVEILVNSWAAWLTDAPPDRRRIEHTFPLRRDVATMQPPYPVKRSARLEYDSELEQLTVKRFRAGMPFNEIVRKYRTAKMTDATFNRFQRLFDANWMVASEYGNIVSRATYGQYVAPTEETV